MKNKDNLSKKIAFVVLSCDNYSDLWDMFIEQFEKHWTDCPYDKFFVTNHKSIPKSSFREIKIGDDISWSDGLIKALTLLKVNYSHIIITLEDLPLIEKVNTNELKEMLSQFMNINGNYLKFIRKPKHTKKFNSNFGIIESGSLYRPTCVYAVWNINTLIYLLRKEENAWQFERFGSVRSDELNGFYVVYTDFFKVLNTVIKGNWVPKELKRLIKNGYTPKINRPLLSHKHSFILKTRIILFNCFVSVIPWRWRRKIVFKLKSYES